MYIVGSTINMMKLMAIQYIQTLGLKHLRLKTDCFGVQIWIYDVTTRALFWIEWCCFENKATGGGGSWTRHRSLFFIKNTHPKVEHAQHTCFSVSSLQNPDLFIFCITIQVYFPHKK